jgi:RNA polymerase sigma-70 factor (ECF subfamily)
MSASNPDPAADFVAFMGAHQDRVYSTAVRILADSVQAEDVAQSVFLKAYERFAELRDSPTAIGWLRAVATNLAINHLKRYRRRFVFLGEGQRDDEEPEDLPELVMPDPVPTAVAGTQRHALVEAALRGLPEHQRVPLVLYHFEELSYLQIAERLQISVAKVKTDLFRGRAALLRTIGEQSATSDLLAG